MHATVLLCSSIYETEDKRTYRKLNMLAEKGKQRMSKEMRFLASAAETSSKSMLDGTHSQRVKKEGVKKRTLRKYLDKALGSGKQRLTRLWGYWVAQDHLAEEANREHQRSLGHGVAGPRRAAETSATATQEAAQERAMLTDADCLEINNVATDAHRNWKYSHSLDVQRVGKVLQDAGFFDPRAISQNGILGSDGSVKHPGITPAIVLRKQLANFERCFSHFQTSDDPEGLTTQMADLVFFSRAPVEELNKWSAVKSRSGHVGVDSWMRNRRDMIAALCVSLDKEPGEYTQVISGWEDGMKVDDCPLMKEREKDFNKYNERYNFLVHLLREREEGHALAERIVKEISTVTAHHLKEPDKGINGYDFEVEQPVAGRISFDQLKSHSCQTAS
jgi:hypothetical protein